MNLLLNTVPQQMHRNYTQKLFKALIFEVVGCLYSQEKMLIDFKEKNLTCSMCEAHFSDHSLLFLYLSAIFIETLLYFTEE